MILFLHNNVAIFPNNTFRGSTVSYFASPNSPIREIISLLVPDYNKNPFNVVHYSRAYEYINTRYGNMHALFDLWNYNIPTIEEFGQTITVPMASFFYKLLGTEGSNNCNCLSVYNLDLRILRALGVRYIITDQPDPPIGASRILEQSVNNKENYLDHELVKKNKEIIELLLKKENYQNGKIIASEFIEQFKENLDQACDSAAHKDLILGGLVGAFKMLDKQALSLSDFNEYVKNNFYGFLYRHAAPNLYLYEIKNPNLATFSPTQPIYLTLASEMFDLMKRPDFCFEQSVIVQDKNLPTNLVTAKNTQMRFKPNEVLVSAESEGWSLLLLPVQYSHCFQVTPLISTTSPENVRLIRANLIQSALLFQGKINVSLKFDFNVRCRSDDVAFWKSAQGLVDNKKN